MNNKKRGLLPDAQVDAARNVDLVELVESYGVKLAKQGGEHFGLCPFHSEDSPSFTVTASKNLYRCMGCGQGGDAIKFVQDYESVSFREAVLRLTGESEAMDAPPPPKKSAPREPKPETWQPIIPVPESAPIMPDTVRRKINGEWVSLTVSRRWTYADANCDTIGYIARFEVPGGGKEVIPQVWAVNTETGECEWRWLSFPKPRPIYGLDLLAAHPGAQVMVVEGEKAADAARDRLAAIGIGPNKLVVVAWPGGAKAIKFVDWTPLTGRRVGLWPDADQKPYPSNHPRAGELMLAHEQPGLQAMLMIDEALAGAVETCRVFVPPAGVPDGWDLADDLPEGFDLLNHIRTAATDPANLRLAPVADEPVPENVVDLEKECAKRDHVEPEAAPAPDPAPESKPKAKREKPSDPGLAGVPPSFTPLGYDHDKYYFFQNKKKQLLEYGPSSFTDTGLLALAPLSFWEESFPADAGLSKKAAINALIGWCHNAGIYDPSRTRGRGAWVDEGRVVLHMGSQLIVDGEPVDITRFPSRFIYELDRSFPGLSPDSLTNEEGRALVRLATMFRWSKPASSAMLAGWVALAPLCGALKWRPHIWLSGGAGSGKAQPHSAKVLTPGGWVTMGDVRVGDLVSTPDNGFARVRGLYPQGVQPVYKITFVDGRVTRATGDHLWKVRVKHAWRIRTTDEMREVLSRGTRAARSLAIPLCEKMTVRDGGKALMLPLPAYVLGIMLGDGSFAKEDGHAWVGGNHLTCFDPEIVNRARVLLEGSEFNFSRYCRKTRETIKDLRLLGTVSDTKFIPRAYLDASIEDRIELLKGLMDTDGHAGEGGSISYCTVSERLRDDVVELVRSLGGIASVAEKKTRFSYKGEVRTGKLAYNINIRLPDPTIAFSLQRKLDRVSDSHQYSDFLYLNVVSIEQDGEEECSCIAIDHPDRLYVTDHFVVTHNTTVLNSYVHTLMNEMAVMAQGNSTEPGIRQELRCDARPVLVDEGEQNDDKERARMQSILAMIRQASSESAARTYKGTSSGKSMHFHIRSMFCLASIQVGMCHQADKERLTVLSLRPKRESSDAAGEWEKIKEALYQVERDKTLPARLFRRSLDLLPITLKNIDVFAKAAAEKFGSQRDGDQYGTLMAGCWSLIHTVEATPEQARALLDHYDWTDYMEHADHDESSSALSALMEARVKVVGSTEWCVHEVVRVAVSGSSSTDLSVEEADRLLQRHGMRVKDGFLLFSNRSEALPRLVAHTSYSTDIRGHLKRVPGATNYDNRAISIGASVSKCVAVPIEKCLPIEPPHKMDMDVAPF